MSDSAVNSFLKISGNNIALLRHEVAGLARRDDSDWDVAVRDCEVARRHAADTMGIPLIEVERQYVEQRYYSWGQVDFLPVFEFDGWEYLEQGRFWGRVRVGEDGIYRPCLAHDAFIAWFCGLLHGGVFNPRYLGLIQEALREEEEEFAACIEWAFGRSWVERLVALGKGGTAAEACGDVRELRFALKWQRVRRKGLGVIGPVASHWFRELRLHLQPPFPWVAFLGPDGSGKSTVIEGVTNAFAPSRLKLRHVHWRPSVRKPLPDELGPPLTDPHGRAPRNTVLSLLALLLLCCRWWAGYAIRLWHRRSKSEVIISDRYYLDLLVDQRRYVYGGPVWLARLLFRWLPKPDFTFILVADPDKILARKAEVAPEELKRQIAAYRSLGEALGQAGVIVDAGQPVDKVVALVVDEMSKRFSSRKKDESAGKAVGAHGRQGRGKHD